MAEKNIIVPDIQMYHTYKKASNVEKEYHKNIP